MIENDREVEALLPVNDKDCAEVRSRACKKWRWYFVGIDHQLVKMRGA